MQNKINNKKYKKRCFTHQYFILYTIIRWKVGDNMKILASDFDNTIYFLEDEEKNIRNSEQLKSLYLKEIYFV